MENPADFWNLIPGLKKIRPVYSRPFPY